MLIYCTKCSVFVINWWWTIHKKIR